MTASSRKDDCQTNLQTTTSQSTTTTVTDQLPDAGQRVTERSASTQTTRAPLCTPPVPETAPAISSAILTDVAAVVPIFASMVSSYRLLVGAAEEIRRIAGVCPDVFERAVRRFDNTGTVIDVLLELLCGKITYSSDFLSITPAPVDLFRLLGNRSLPCDLSHRTAEQIVLLEALRQALNDCLDDSPCLSPQPVICSGDPPAPDSVPLPASERPSAKYPPARSAPAASGESGWTPPGGGTIANRLRRGHIQAWTGKTNPESSCR